MIRHILICFLLIAPSVQKDILQTEQAVENPKLMRSSQQSILPCNVNGVVASWCDMTVNSDLACAINPDFDLYSCTCENDATACPSECIGGSISTNDKRHYAIECLGIPQDEPNYILKTGEFASCDK
jgi:hypothetical protein